MAIVLLWTITVLRAPFLCVVSASDWVKCCIPHLTGPLRAYKRGAMFGNSMQSSNDKQLNPAAPGISNHMHMDRLIRYHISGAVPNTD